MVTELKNKSVTLRKRRRCNWCGEWCEVGETAHYRVSIFDGQFNSDHLHPECYEALCNSDWQEYEEYMPHEQERGKTMEESHG